MVVYDTGEISFCPCCGKRVRYIPNDVTFPGIPHMCNSVVCVTSEELPKKVKEKSTFIKDKIDRNKPKWMR